MTGAAAALVAEGGLGTSEAAGWFLAEALPLARTWTDWILPVLLQTTLLILVVGLVERLLRRRAWPQLVHALWILVLAKHLLPPRLFLPISLSAQMDWSSDGSALGGLVVPLPSSLFGAVSDLSAGSVSAASGASVLAFLPLLLMGLWALGVMGCAMYGIRRQSRLRRQLLDGAEPLPAAFEPQLAAAATRLRLRRSPRVVWSPSAKSPAILGLWKPVVIVPAHLAARLTAEDLEHVLLHELAHLRRRDLWFQALFTVVHWLFWFQPLMPWVVRRAYESRELCCDATVAASLGEEAPAYRKALVRAARTILDPAPWPRPAMAALVAGGGTLERLWWLERGSGRNLLRRRVVAGVIFVVLAVTLLPMAPESPAVQRARDELSAAVARGSSLQVKYAVMGLHALLDEEPSAGPPEATDP